MHRRHFILAAATPLLSAQRRRMQWGDNSRLGRPFAKDPSVLRLGSRYLLYYSIPNAPDDPARSTWAIGIAESTNLLDWKKVAEILPAAPYEGKGLCAPFATLRDGEVHLFYQTYGNGREDAICHAVSPDGLRFTRDQTNPIFRPHGSWNAGRAIDAEVVAFQGKWFLYAATRDPDMKIQMLVGAVSDGGFDRNSWRMIADAPILKPELPWERDCIEAPAIVRRGNKLYMFYAGGYNNAPQQIGCARSSDGVRWERIFTEPLLANGAPGEWNSSESGHPGTFVDRDGQTYLFYQGNNDKGRTWLLSWEKIGWRNDRPFLQR